MIYKFLNRRNNRSIKVLAVFFLIISFISPALKAQLVAFPGAEGYGRLTTGGRGGAVFEVTNLNDSGAGSLRDAIGKNGARTIVFTVSGTIELKSDLKISKGDLTIAGQTAPGDGICLRNYTLSVQANNVIIRFIRSRYGNTIISNEDDAVHGTGTYRNIIIDHCSFSWSVDETATFYDNIDFTMQWCLISESLYRSNHDKGEHGYGGIWGGQGATFHHNLLAHHSSRNPRFNGSRYSRQPQKEIVDFVNNVIYNWGFNSAYGGEEGNQNIRANYYKPGPATKSGVRNRIVQPTKDPNTDTKFGKFYVADNYVDGSPSTTADNWGLGVQGVFGIDKDTIRATTPFPIATVTTQTPQDAYISVLNYVGACIPKRDAVDTRIFNEVLNGTVTYGDKSYPKEENMDTTKIYGIIDSQETVGGWPVLNSSNAPADTDHDGMPDDWELAHGLNPNNASDRNNIDVSSGYTMFEVYLNSLVSSVVVTSVKDNLSSVPPDFKLYQNYPNPFNPETTIQYMIPSAGLVEIKIYDINGRLVKELFQGFNEAGIHEINWKGMNQAGSKVASGNYFCTVKFKNQFRSLKLVLLK